VTCRHHETPPERQHEPWGRFVLAILGAVLLTYWPMLMGNIVFLRDTALWILMTTAMYRQKTRLQG
jgi:hypothetical protein